MKSRRVSETLRDCDRSVGRFCTPGIIRAATLTMSHKRIVQYHVSERDQMDLRRADSERENGTSRRCN